MLTRIRLKKRNFKRLFFILFIILTNQNLITSQTNIIKGTVINRNNSPIDYFTVALRNKNDSSIITGSAFLDGKFAIDFNNDNQSILQISSVGYKQITTPFSKGETILPDTFIMENLNLDEVVISARKPKIKQKGGKTIVTIEGTALEDIGSSFDILKSTPNIQVNNKGEVNIFGKGSPLIMIDNREISSLEELNTIQSSNIKSIEVDKNPSAITQSNANSVIRITTKRKNNFSAEIYNRSYYGRKYSNKAGINIVQPYKKIKSLISYNHYLSNEEYYNDDYEINDRSEYQIQNTTQSINVPKSTTHSLLTGFEYFHDSTNATNILYHLSLYDEDFFKRTFQHINKSNTNPIDKEIYLLTIQDKNQHNLSISHKKTFKPTSSLFISSDYAYVLSKEKTRIKEITKNSTINTDNQNKDDYNVFTFTTRYINQLNENNAINIGLRSAIVKNIGSTNSINKNDLNINYSEQQNTKDIVSAIYCTYKYTNEKYNCNIGVRTEHTQTHTKLNSVSIVDSSYFHFFPSIQFSYYPYSSFGISLNFNHKIERPYFSDLNPTKTYYDSLSYRQGNPFLKPTIKRNFALDFDLLWNISFSTEYTRYNNKIVLATTNDNKNPDVIKYTPINIDKSERILLGLVKSFNGKTQSTSISTGIEFPFIDIPYLGEIKKVRRKNWYLSLNNDIAIGKKIILYASFDYFSKSIDAITTIDSYYNLWAGASVKFFDKRLVISVDMDNILNSNNNNWKDKFEYITSGGNNNLDNRIFRVSIKYNFKHFKNIVNTNSNNKQELDRL